MNSILKISIKDILIDNISLYKGIVAENYVVNQWILSLLLAKWEYSGN